VDGDGRGGGPAAPVLDVDTNNTILNDGCGGVWTSPTIIERDNVEIVAVADCHFESPPPYNERVLALNIADGSTKWVFFPPRGDDPDCDFDFGATANLGTALDGTPAFLGICGKDGYCYSLDSTSMARASRIRAHTSRATGSRRAPTGSSPAASRIRRTAASSSVSGPSGPRSSRACAAPRSRRPTGKRNRRSARPS